MSWRYHNSTIILGDFNTTDLNFCSIDQNRSAVGTFGRSMPGKQHPTYHVNEIDPVQCLGYSNVVVHCGINSIRQNCVNSHKDVKIIYDEFKSKLDLIKKLNRNCKLYVCPTLPTKRVDYNRKANLFNSFIRNDLVNTNLGVVVVDGFDSFLDHDGFLAKELSRSKQGDTLHLNGKGIGKLAKLIKTTIFEGKHRGSRIVSNRLFSSVVSGGHDVT